MTVLDLLWPILLTGVATHIASTLAWMVLPHHKPEWKELPVEDQLLAFLDKHQVPAQQYMFPFCHSSEQMKSEEFQTKINTGCKGLLILWPTPLNMGAAIARTFAYFMITAFVLGYLASVALAPGAEFSQVFSFVAAAAVLPHCFGPFPGVFWFRKYYAMEVADGVVYSLLTGLIFASLWPSAV